MNSLHFTHCITNNIYTMRIRRKKTGYRHYKKSLLILNINFEISTGSAWSEKTSQGIQYTADRQKHNLIQSRTLETIIKNDTSHTETDKIEQDNDSKSLSKPMKFTLRQTKQYKEIRNENQNGAKLGDLRKPTSDPLRRNVRKVMNNSVDDLNLKKINRHTKCSRKEVADSIEKPNCIEKNSEEMIQDGGKQRIRETDSIKTVVDSRNQIPRKMVENQRKLLESCSSSDFKNKPQPEEQIHRAKNKHNPDPGQENSYIANSKHIPNDAQGKASHNVPSKIQEITYITNRSHCNQSQRNKSDNSAASNGKSSIGNNYRVVEAHFKMPNSSKVLETGKLHIST